MTLLKPWQKVCPKCGNKHIIEIKRITGYLSFTERWCDAKLDEAHDRVNHN